VIPVAPCRQQLVFDDSFDLVDAENREHNEFTIVGERSCGWHWLTAVSCKGSILRRVYIEADDGKAGMEETMRQCRAEKAKANDPDGVGLRHQARSSMIGKMLLGTKP